MPRKVTAIHHCKNFTLNLNVLLKEMLMLRKETSLLVLIMFIKLHEHTIPDNKLSQSFLNTHLSATCHKIQCPPLLPPLQSALIILFTYY